MDKRESRRHPALVPTHKSDSSVQHEAEAEMLAALAKSLEIDFTAMPERLPELKGLEPDGIDWTNRVLVEAYARVGKLKGGQLHKVKGDILKLLFLERTLGGKWRKVLCFGDKTVAESLPKSWIGVAAQEFDVEVCLVPHSTDMVGRLLKCQGRQRMVNA